MPVVDLLLHGDQHPAHTLADVEVVAAAQRVHDLELADVQHPPNHAAEATAFIGDDLEVLPLVLRRNRSVQNAVGIAGNGGHRGLQLVGDIGDELPALALRLLKALRHIIERGRQFADLIVPAVVVHADVKIALGILPGGRRHFPDRLDLPHGGNRGCHEGDHQHHQGRHEKQAHEALPHGVQRGAGGHGEHLAHHLAAGGIHGGHAHHEPLVFIQAAQIVPGGGLALLHNLPGHLCRHGHRHAGQVLVRREQHMAFPVADHKVHIGHRGGKGGQLPEVPVILQLLNREEAAALQVIHGKLAHDHGFRPDLPALLAAGIVIAQGAEGSAQQHQCQQNHAYGDEHLPPIQSLKTVKSAHSSAFSACLPPVSSNL